MRIDLEIEKSSDGDNLSIDQNLEKPSTFLSIANFSANYNFKLDHMNQIQMNRNYS